MQQKCQFLGTRKLGGMIENHAKTYIHGILKKKLYKLLFCSLLKKMHYLEDHAWHFVRYPFVEIRWKLAKVNSRSTNLYVR